MHDSLREQILKQIRSEIISGESRPGSLYSVPALAAELDVSTTPVREALLELANAGLVEPIRNRGFRVSQLTVSELEDIFDMRELLELHAARRMMANGFQSTRELSGYADQIALAVKEDSVQDYLIADRQFHNAMFMAAGNHVLTKSALELRDRMRLFGIRSSAGFERQRESVDEHYRIVELIEAGDAEQLCQTLRVHISSWKPIFSAALEAQSQGRRRQKLGLDR
ncbi:GntR family transcriptional regulator [Salinicola acroporae]|nr:GntR family transcriptional regulator [Salinicola acroporae]